MRVFVIACVRACVCPSVNNSKKRGKKQQISGLFAITNHKKTQSINLHYLPYPKTLLTHKDASSEAEAEIKRPDIFPRLRRRVEPPEIWKENKRRSFGKTVKFDGTHWVINGWPAIYTNPLTVCSRKLQTLAARRAKGLPYYLEMRL